MKYIIKFIAFVIALEVVTLVHHFADYLDPDDPFGAVVMFYGVILAYLVYRVCTRFQFTLLDGLRWTIRRSRVKPGH